MRRRDTAHTGLLAALAAAALILSLGEAMANEARVQGMSANPMVEDDVDIVDFPGMTEAYSNSVFLNALPSDPYGNFGFLVGDVVAFGAWIHRSWEWMDLETTSDLLGLDLPRTHEIADIFFGIEHGFGIRLSLAAGLASTDEVDPDDETDDTLYSTGESTFAIDVQPGFSFDSGPYHGDFGVGLTFSSFNVAIAGRQAYTSTGTPSFVFRHRSIIGERADLASWIIDLDLSRRAYTAQSLGNYEDEAKFSRWNASLVVGPKLSLPGDFTLWLGGRFPIEQMSGEMESQLQPSLLGIGAPGLIASGELRLFDVFLVRAGVDYDVYWTISDTPREDDDSKVGLRERDMGQRFGWSTGLGLALGDFVVDGTVSQQLYFNGPQIIGGGNPGFLGRLSVAYLW